MWMLLSLGTAFFAGTSDALAKKALQTERVMTVSWVRAGWGALFMLPFLFLGAPPSDPRTFWISIGCALPLEVLASLSLQTALRSSPISTCIPFLAFTPVFLTLTGWFFLGETVSVIGALGVAAVAGGAFILHSQRQSNKDDSTASIKGPLLVLLVAFLYSITAVFAKRALVASSPFTFCGWYYLALAVCLSPFQIRAPKELIHRPVLFSAIGMAEAASFLFQFHALMLAPVAYVVAIKRLSLLIAVVYGRLLFDERNIRARAGGALLMAAGAAMLAFA